MFRHFMAPNDSNVVSWFYVAFPTSSSRDDSSLHLAPRPLQPQIWVIFLVLPHIGPFIFSVYLFLCGRVRPSNTSSRFSTCFVCFQCRFADMQTPLFQPPRMHITGQRIWRMRWKREPNALYLDLVPWWTLASTSTVESTHIKPRPSTSAVMHVPPPETMASCSCLSIVG